MPIIKGAKKALRQTRSRTVQNRGKKKTLGLLVTKFKKQKDAKTYSLVSSLLDKMAKKGVIHKNKASRLKSRLSKLVVNKTTVSPVVKPKAVAKKVKSTKKSL